MSRVIEGIIAALRRMPTDNATSTHPARKWLRSVAIVVVVGSFLTAAAMYLHRTNIAVLEPHGTVGAQERHLIVIAVLLSAIVVIPVFALLFAFAWRYREGNAKRAKYSPNLAGSRAAETIWWLIPSALILILSVITWNSSHSLDPYKTLSSNVKPLNVEVVALDWKWLFIYPDQHVASVNLLEIPVNTPINFTVTADAPMNSFWIPQLGGQIYAMPGMSTQLHLMATSTGDYHGSSANISGVGFAGMNFTARAASASGFASWVASAQKSSNVLSNASYNKLAQPSQNVAPIVYKNTEGNLYGTIMMKYMMPGMQGMDAQ